MTAPGVTVIPICPPTEREEQLEAEVTELRAAVRELRERLEVPDVKVGDDLELICVGSALIGEHDGRLWLVRGGQLRWLGRASAEELAIAAEARARVAAQRAERRRSAS